VFQSSMKIRDSSLYNEDLAPVPADGRTWGTWNIAALWVGMAVCIPTYTLAAGLIAQGMNWRQALATITLGNLVVLVPMMLNAHAGTRYGVPFPVLLRASFGTLGANVPALMRALVACGWFGIQTWIGGSAIYTLHAVIFGFEPAGPGDLLPGLGLSLGQLACFLLFWILNVAVILAGIESIKWLETLAAPFLLVIGLPTTMALYSFIGIAVTSATVLIFGAAIWDPVELLGRFPSKVTVAIALFALTVATLSTNIAANVVSPANDFSNLWPRRISFKRGGLITGLIGILIMPWKLYTDLSQYIFTWLIGYGALLGAVAGVMLADYYLLRRARLDVEALYLEDGEYAFGGSGFNWRALAAVAFGIAVNVPGFLSQASGGSIQVAPIFDFLYTYAWFVSLLIAGIAHTILSTAFPPPATNAAGSDEQGASR